MQGHRSRISLPQNSGSNVYQPTLVEQPVLEEQIRDYYNLVPKMILFFNERSDGYG